MRPPTGNVISQRQHGTSKAVDYSARPDATVYAPEDMTWDSYQQRGSGRSNAGNALRMNGAHGLHQFAHLERILITPGQSVKKGQAIAIMGYTGYTIPAGPAGRHLHWWILKNGVYTYPPTLVTEAFNAQPTHRYLGLVGKIIELNPYTGTWSVYARNGDNKVATLKGKGLRYWVRDVSARGNRVVINSASAGGLVDLPLADAKGNEYSKEWRQV